MRKRSLGETTSVGSFGARAWRDAQSLPSRGGVIAHAFASHAQKRRTGRRPSLQTADRQANCGGVLRRLLREIFNKARRDLDCAFGSARDAGLRRAAIAELRRRNELRQTYVRGARRCGTPPSRLAAFFSVRLLLVFVAAGLVAFVLLLQRAHQGLKIAQL